MTNGLTQLSFGSFMFLIVRNRFNFQINLQTVFPMSTNFILDLFGLCGKRINTTVNITVFFRFKEFKVGELIKPKKDSDIARRIYAFTAETKEVQNKVSGHWEYCLQVYLKVEPVADDKEHKRSKRELGEAICHPKLFGDEPTEISLSGVPG